MDAALETMDVWIIRDYVRMQKAKIAEYVAGRPIYKLCTGTWCVLQNNVTTFK